MNFRCIAGLAAAFLLPACSTLPPVPASELAPTGNLRIAINYGNVVLARRDAAGQPVGVAIDLAHAAAKRAQLPLVLVQLPSPPAALEAVKTGQADAAFLAVEASRALDVDFSSPYVQIQAAYAVRQDSTLRTVAEVDRAGTRIAVSQASGYDLYLTRSLQAASLVRLPQGKGAVEALFEGKADVAAGLRQAMLQESRKRQDLRLLEGDFMLIDHAFAVPKGRSAAQAWYTQFVEEMKRSNMIADALVRHGSEGARQAPARR